MTFFEINKPLLSIFDRNILFVIILALSAIVLGTSNLPHVMADQCGGSTGTANPGIYVDYNTNFADHGTLISICDPTITKNWLSVTITSGTDLTGITTPDPRNNPGNSAIFTQNGTGWFIIPAGNLNGNIVPGYLMYNVISTNPAVPSIMISNTLADIITIKNNDNLSMPVTSVAIVPSGTTIPSQYTSVNTNNQPYKTKNLAGTCTDTDGDGLCDTWENNLLPVSGTIMKMEITWTANSVKGVYDYFCDTTVPAKPVASYDGLGTLANPDPICPDPNKKDIFVEVDYMQRHHPSKSAIDAVVQSFAAHSINLHVQVDQEIPFHKDQMSIPSPGAPAASTDFDIWKTWFFGTPSEQTCPNGATSCQLVKNVLTIKRQFFHYAIYGHSQTVLPGSSGSSELPGNDMLISLGAFTGGVGSVDQQSGTFMHELGHNLGLYHGGAYPSLNPADDSYDNCKPNYLSVMSYSRQFSDLDPNRSLDYSSGLNPSLLEQNLNEGVQLTSPVQGQSALWSNNGISISRQTIPSTLIPGFFDWDGNNNANTTPESGLQINLNNLGISGCNTNDMTTLADNNDWSTLQLNFKGVSGFYDGAPISTVTGDTVSQIKDPKTDHDGHAKGTASDGTPGEEYFACTAISKEDDRILHSGKPGNMTPSSSSTDELAKPNDGKPVDVTTICSTLEKNDKSVRMHGHHHGGLDIDSSINLRILHVQKLLKYINSTDVAAFVTSNATFNVGKHHKANLINNTDDLTQNISNNEIAGTFLQTNKIVMTIADTVSNQTVNSQLNNETVDLQNSLSKAAQPQEFYPDVVVPEFGPVAVFVLLASIIVVIFVTRSNILTRL